MKTYKGILTKEIVGNGIFVFGSNTQGRHGKGSAQYARLNFGAIYGQAKGLQGKSYAIITKDLTKRNHPSISKDYIVEQIKELYDLANKLSDIDFYVPYTDNSINLNAYSSQEMAEMFNQKPIPTNIVFEESFAKLIQERN